MRVLKIDKCCISDGNGIRLSLYCSGCDIHCKGCHNVESWDINRGELYTEEMRQEILTELSKSFYAGVTFVGGEPTMPENINDFTDLAKDIKEILPDKNIWLYTGKEWDQIKDLEIMQYVDVAVVGPFILEQRDISDENRWRGSRNQRVILVPETLCSDHIVYMPDIPNNSNFVPYIKFTDYLPDGITFTDLLGKEGVSFEELADKFVLDEKLNDEEYIKKAAEYFIAQNPVYADITPVQLQYAFAEYKKKNSK